MTLAVLGIGYVLFRGCSGDDGGPPILPPETPVDPAKAASLSGAVKFTGAVPPRKMIQGGTPDCTAIHDGDFDTESVCVNDGKVQYAFVCVSKGLPSPFSLHPWIAAKAPPPEAVLDQKTCVFIPHVQAIQIGQPLVLRNSDRIVHNTHFQRDEGRRANYQIQGGMETRIWPAVAHEMEPLLCDVHPGFMRGYFAVVDHPFFKVTGTDGVYAFKGMPAGEYTISVWTEGFQPTSGTVTLAPGDDKTLDFELKLK